KDQFLTRRVGLCLKLSKLFAHVVADADRPGFLGTREKLLPGQPQSDKGRPPQSLDLLAARDLPVANRLIRTGPGDQNFAVRVEPKPLRRPPVTKACCAEPGEGACRYWIAVTVGASRLLFRPS